MQDEATAPPIEGDAATSQAAGIDPAVPAPTEAKPIYTGSLVALDPIDRMLADLKARHEGVVYDLTTTKGDKAARQARLELVKTRTGAKKTFDAWYAPIKLEREKGLERVKQIEEEVRKLEEPLDLQIKADEARRAKEKEERERIEAERVATIRGRINIIVNLPVTVVEMSLTAEQIAESLADLELLELTEERYGEFLEEAKAAAASTTTKLQNMHAAAVQQEAMAEQMRKQQAELDRQKAEMAAQKAELDRQKAEQEEVANKARILQEERDRAAADKAARDAEDAKRQAAGQSDAFAAEKSEAVQVVREHNQAERAERLAARPAPVPAPAPAPVPAAPAVPAGHAGNATTGYIAPAPQQAAADDVNAAAAMASYDDRQDSQVDPGFAPVAFEDAKAPWAPDAQWIVDAVAQVADTNDRGLVLQWLQDIDFSSLTLGDIDG